MAKSVSCAVLLLNDVEQVLLCHVTGHAWWDVPKGMPEAGETPRHTAVRELHEETGIVLEPDALLDLGRVGYRPVKDLHLFAALRRADDLVLDDCRCTSTFRHPRTGTMTPEVDAFAWVPFGEVAARCAPAMVRVLTGTVNLAGVLERLSGPTGPR